MTGYGRSEVKRSAVVVTAEVKSVNNRFLETTFRFPRSLSRRENELKEIVRSKLTRGSVNVVIKMDRNGDSPSTLHLNADAAKAYHKLLNNLRKTVKLKEPVKLQHLLTFSEIFQGPSEDDVSESEWAMTIEALTSSLDELNAMRGQEGAELGVDLKKRIEWLNETIDTVDRKTKERIPVEREKLHERVSQLMVDPAVVSKDRLELEIVLLADRLDVTEECVRFRSHNKFFLEAMAGKEPCGRKLGFLIQEMNREANTIGSKCGDAGMQHLIVAAKEELEKIREQIQNIE
jgi:uncharacterized protein (TIGR00255 family)